MTKLDERRNRRMKRVQTKLSNDGIRQPSGKMTNLGNVDVIVEAQIDQSDVDGSDNVSKADMDNWKAKTMINDHRN